MQENEISEKMVSMKNILSLSFIILMLFSCGRKTDLNYRSTRIETIERARRLEELETERLARDEEKRRTWDEIVLESRQSFKSIEPLLKFKCYACHDSNTKLPIYGRILRRHNPVNHHREDGIKALDLAAGFPFKAQGNPSQISLLKAIKYEIVTRKMPLKVYTSFYRKRRIFEDDEKQILQWIDPLLQRLEDFDQRFKPQDQTPLGQTVQLFEQKCIRCHGNGANRGGFGNIEDLKSLAQSRYVNKEDPEASILYQVMAKGEMPPNPSEALNPDELSNIKQWIENSRK